MLLSSHIIIISEIYALKLYVVYFYIWTLWILMTVVVFICVFVYPQLLRTASLQANIYNMEPGQVLLQVS